MASLLDDENLCSAPSIDDDDDDDDKDLEIEELVVDDLPVVDMLGEHEDVVSEVTVLDSASDRNDPALEVPAGQEVVLDSVYAFGDPVSSAEPEIDVSTDYMTSAVSQGSGRKTKVGGKMKKQGAKAGGKVGTVSRGVRRWERRPVQIKTLEGEFTVTVWATGMIVVMGDL